MPVAATPEGDETQGRGTEPLGQIATSSHLANTVIFVIFYGSALVCKDLLRHFYLLTVQCLNACQWKSIKHVCACTHMRAHTHTQFSFAENVSHF